MTDDASAATGASQLYSNGQAALAALDANHANHAIERVPSAALTSRQQPRRDRAEHLIATSLKDADLAIAYLCRELQMSRATLCRLFVQDGGVQAYILSKRLEAVRDVLLAGPHDVALNDLARIWRFSDASHLARRFKKRYGWPPKQYQQLHAAQLHLGEGAAVPISTTSSNMPEAVRVRQLEEENRTLKRLLGSLTRTSE